MYIQYNKDTYIHLLQVVPAIRSRDNSRRIKTQQDMSSSSLYIRTKAKGSDHLQTTGNKFNNVQLHTSWEYRFQSWAIRLHYELVGSFSPDTRVPANV